MMQIVLGAIAVQPENKPRNSRFCLQKYKKVTKHYLLTFFFFFFVSANICTFALEKRERAAPQHRASSLHSVCTVLAADLIKSDLRLIDTLKTPQGRKMAEG